jgi:hypothetical protein
VTRVAKRLDFYRFAADMDGAKNPRRRMSAAATEIKSL